MSMKPMVASPNRDVESSEEGEQRLHNRSRFLVDLFFDGAEATGVASTRDISPGGLYMNTQAVLPEGALLRLRLPFGAEQVEVNAEVIYSNPGHGVGVRFQDMSKRDRAIVEAVLVCGSVEMTSGL